MSADNDMVIFHVIGSGYSTHANAMLTNLFKEHDVDGDSSVTARDALLIVNHIARTSPPVPMYYYDVNSDLTITAADALAVINQMARLQLAVGREELRREFENSDHQDSAAIWQTDAASLNRNDLNVHVQNLFTLNHLLVDELMSKLANFAPLEPVEGSETSNHGTVFRNTANASKFAVPAPHLHRKYDAPIP